MNTQSLEFTKDQKRDGVILVMVDEKLFVAPYAANALFNKNGEPRLVHDPKMAYRWNNIDFAKAEAEMAAQTYWRGRPVRVVRLYPNHRGELVTK